MHVQIWVFPDVIIVVTAAVVGISILIQHDVVADAGVPDIITRQRDTVLVDREQDLLQTRSCAQASLRVGDPHGHPAERDGLTGGSGGADDEAASGRVRDGIQHRHIRRGGDDRDSGEAAGEADRN